MKSKPSTYPASGTQAMFWHLAKYNPQSGAQIVVTAYRIDGQVQVGALKAAFDAYAATQPALRTLFFENHSGIYQRIFPSLPVSFYHREYDTQDADMDALSDIEGLQDFVSTPFNLEVGPLMRVRLESLGSHKHLITIAAHHIVSDSTSFVEMFKAVSEYYNGLVSNKTPSIAGPKITMGKLAADERVWIHGDDVKKHLDYWLRILRRGGLHHPWPRIGSPLSTSDSGAGEEMYLTFELDPGLSTAIQKLALQVGISRFRILLGGYFLTLHRLLPGKAVTAGVVVDQRRAIRGSEGVFGCLINTLPVTMQATTPNRILDYLLLAASELDEALEHASVPYTDMIAVLLKEETGILSSRWRTLINFKSSEGGALQLAGTTAELPCHYLNEIVQDGLEGELTITMYRDWHRFEGSPIPFLVKYDTRALSLQQVNAIVESWLSVLRQCTESPEIPVDRIELPRMADNYAAWMRHLNAPGTRDRLENYWRERLSDMADPVRIEPDLLPPESSPGSMGCRSHGLDDNLLSRVDVYCKKEGLSRLAAWMSLWQVLQSRLGMGQQVVLETPVSKWILPDRPDKPGMCLNTLPIRAWIDPSDDFLSYSRHTQQNLTQDIAHASLPYEDILRVSQIDLGPESRGLPQVLFILNGGSDGNGEYSVMDEDAASMEGRHVRNPLSIHISDHRGHGSITIRYDADRFSTATAEALLQRFVSLAMQVLQKPDIRIKDIDILIPGEWEKIREFSGQHHVEGYPNLTLDAIFRLTALRYPDRPAVIQPDGTVTSYKYIQKQASRIAKYILETGECRDKIVGIYASRSPALIVSMLGVLEAGGGFLLLEPSLPLERLRQLSDQANVSAIISEEGLPPIFGFCDRTVSIGDILSLSMDETTESSQVVKPDDIAYVFFTSGSTGLPKGIMVEHRNIVNYLLFCQKAYGFGPEGRTLLRSTLSFDMCIFELLLPIISGGGIVLAASGCETDMQHVADLTVTHRVTHLAFSPAIAAFLMKVPDIEKINETVKVIVCGGDVFPESLMKDMLDTLSAKLFQDYGPTETTVAVTLWECRVNHGCTHPPIGKPNDHVNALVMDKLGRPVPPGLPGELWIGGAQTSRGYINNDEETRRCFVRDPLEPGSGRRYYRTGDLARFLPDGNLLFLGRIDDQVKVRGVRIELGDVTSALLRSKGIKEAVILPEPDGEGSHRLRAWVTPQPDKTISEASIRNELAQRLPAYMIPFRIHLIDRIPLTTHGKTDHRALRALAAADPDTLLQGLPLSTPTEQRLANLWSELLRVDVQFRDADFFRLGGHSLLAMRLSAAIQRHFGTTLSLSDFYAQGRLDLLAARIDAQLAGDSDGLNPADLPPIRPGQRIPMSTAQRRMWMLQQLLPHPDAYHVTLLLPIPSGRSPQDVNAILQALAHRHAILRTRLRHDDDGFWQEELSLDDWNLDWDECHPDGTGQRDSLLEELRARPFDLGSGSAWRARWMHGPGEPRLYLVFHHAITDEWSSNRFRQELLDLLAGNLSPDNLPQPAFRYTDFARWQHLTLDNDRRSRLEAYWQERFDGMGEPVRLPTDITPADSAPGHSALTYQDVPQDLHVRLERYARQHGLSRFAVWMALWQILQARLGNGPDVLLATPVSERSRPEWQDILGMCLNTLPIRARVDPADSFHNFCRQTHHSLTRDLAHALLPYEDILRTAHIDLGPDSHGLPQVMFVLHGEQEWSEADELQEDASSPTGEHVKNPLSIHIADRENEGRISLLYDTDRFHAATAEALLQRFLSLATQALQNPDIRIEDIDILLPGEQQHLLELSGRHNVVDYPKTTLQQIFRQSAELYPDRPAVISPDGIETSYAQLQAQARQVAAFLRSLGMEKQAIVAVHLQRSPALLAAILGVLEAGGAFLLLEPSIPLDRLRTMAEQAQVAAILADTGMPVLPGFERSTHTLPDILAADLSFDSVSTQPSRPDDLACIIFTSGSTGVPKGAMLEHHNLVNYFLFLRQEYEMDASFRTLQKTKLSFDLSLCELLLPMFSAGAVIMTGTDLETDMARIADLVQGHLATYLFLTPAQLKLFLEVPDVSRINGTLRFLVSAGEALEESVMRRCLDTLDVRLYNAYGPAETAITVTRWPCHNVHGHPTPPIGIPNPNVDILIMDAQGHPVPPGLPGELLIGGAQTGRGYIHNPEETVKRFVGDPLEPGSGRRYYRTGDLARFLPDGNLLFLGRIDDQVKVRGVRIEPGDIRSAILRCNGILDAVVLTEPDGEGSQRLRAWVTRKDGTQIIEQDIRAGLGALLPSYMIPFRIHLIDRMPLTMNGKTDLRALRTMASEDDASSDDGLPLSTPTEHRLANLWSELLRVDVKFRDADFFRLGGHSLIVIRMLDKIQSLWGVRPDISTFFMKPTLESMALFIDQRMIRNISPEKDALIEPVKAWDTGHGDLICAFVGGAGSEEEFTKYHLIGRVLGKNWRIHILPDPETSRSRFPTTGLDVLASRYTKAILPICQEQKVWLLGDCIGGHDAIAVASALEKAGVGNLGVILMDSVAPNPDPDQPLKSQCARDIFRLMRDKGNPWQEAWFRLYLMLSRFKPARKLVHVRPGSKTQLASMARAYGLFDPEYYARHLKDPMISTEHAFMHYLENGWEKGELLPNDSTDTATRGMSRVST